MLNVCDYQSSITFKLVTAYLRINRKHAEINYINMEHKTSITLFNAFIAYGDWVINGFLLQLKSQLETFQEMESCAVTVKSEREKVK